MGASRLLSPRSGARRRRRQAQALSRAVGELPMITRRAMLAALEADELIVGAYTDRSGRVCPMLAAHRRGARTDVGSFPRAWDAFARAARPRPATRHELEILKALLQESLDDSRPSTDSRKDGIPRGLGQRSVRATVS
jgi:hypothetical protein